MEYDEEKHPEEEAATAVAEHESTALDPVNPDPERLRQMATTPVLQALWAAVLPLVGVLPARPHEYPGVFKVEPGPGTDEATIFVDIPNEKYEPGKPPRMERVISLTVKLAHDYRLLGDRYYCVDCEVPEGETRH